LVLFFKKELLSQSRDHHAAQPGAARPRSGIIILQRGRSAVSTILLVILILLLLGALPTWPYSTGWGYYPSGGLGLVLVIIIVLVLMGRI
jgi:hypothetical protein